MFRRLRKAKSLPQAQLSAAEFTESLGLERATTIEAIHSLVESHHGKPVELKAVSDGTMKTLSGLWAETQTRSYVFYREADSTIYQLHSVLHEFGHILANHTGCSALAVVNRNDLSSAGVGQQIQTARGRGKLSSDEEQFAEEMAYTLSLSVFAAGSANLVGAFS